MMIQLHKFHTTERKQLLLLAGIKNAPVLQSVELDSNIAKVHEAPGPGLWFQILSNYNTTYLAFSSWHAGLRQNTLCS